MTGTYTRGKLDYLIDTTTGNPVGFVNASGQEVDFLGNPMNSKVPVPSAPAVPPSRKMTVVLLGHSFLNPAATSPDPNYSAPSYNNNPVQYSKIVFDRANFLLNSPFTIISNQGITGQTSAQILARLPQALALQPGWLYLDCHTNDYYNSITAAQSIANTLSIIQQANAQGIQVILALDIPRAGGYTQANIQALAQVSDYFKDYAITNPGVIVFDPCQWFLDTTSYANSYNGVPLAANYLSDSIHPNAQGAGLAAQALANLLKPLIPVVRRRSSFNSDGGNGSNGDRQIVNRNPLMIGTGGFTGTGASGSVATGAFVARISGSGLAITASKVSRASVAATFPGLFDDGAQGELQALALASAAAPTDLGYITMSSGSSTYDASLAGTGPYVVEAEIGVNMSSGTLASLDIGFSSYITGSGVWACTANYNTDASDYLNLSKFQGVLRTRPFYLPSPLDSAQSHFCQIRYGTSTGGAGTIYIGNFMMRKVLA